MLYVILFMLINAFFIVMLKASVVSVVILKVTALLVNNL